MNSKLIKILSEAEDKKSKDIKFKSNEPGKCPMCGTENLEYGSIDIEDNLMGYPWQCKTCGAKGTEWYTTQFDSHDVHDMGNQETPKKIKHK